MFVNLPRGCVFQKEGREGGTEGCREGVPEPCAMADKALDFKPSSAYVSPHTRCFSVTSLSSSINPMRHKSHYYHHLCITCPKPHPPHIPRKQLVHLAPKPGFPQCSVLYLLAKSFLLPESVFCFLIPRMKKETGMTLSSMDLYLYKCFVQGLTNPASPLIS